MNLTKRKTAKGRRRREEVKGTFKNRNNFFHFKFSVSQFT